MPRRRTVEDVAEFVRGRLLQPEAAADGVREARDLSNHPDVLDALHPALRSATATRVGTLAVP